MSGSNVLTTIELQVDSNGNRRKFYATWDGNAYALCQVPFVNGFPVTSAMPNPVSDSALGLPDDIVWPGSGDGNVIGILKAIQAAIADIQVSTVVPPMTYHGPYSGSVQTASGLLIPHGAYSRSLVIQTFPNSLTNVWLNPGGGQAFPNQGIMVQAAGGSVSFGSAQFPIPTNDIMAITDGSGPQNVLIVGG